MKSLAVFFPGIGYSNQKPLMYLTEKLFSQQGVKCIRLEWSSLPSAGTPQQPVLTECINQALSQAELQLQDVDFAGYDRITFVGKSIGTAVAVNLLNNRSLVKVPAEKISLVLYTPVSETFQAIKQLLRKTTTDSRENDQNPSEYGLNKRTLVFSGTADPWINAENYIEWCEKNELTLVSIHEANHSLETGCVEQDIQTLEYVISCVRKTFIQKA